MNSAMWSTIDPKIRELIVSAFRMAGIDLERDWLETEQEVRPNTSRVSPWLSREEAAAYAKCSLDTIDNWREEGFILDFKSGDGRPAHVLIDQDSLEEYIRVKAMKRRKSKRKPKNEK